MPRGCTVRVVVASAVELGKLIRQRRAELDVSQDEFGDVVGVPWDQAKVSRYERGRIPATAALEVAKVVGMTRDQVEAILGQPAGVSEPRPPGFAERVALVERRLDAVERLLALLAGDHSEELAEVHEMQRLTEELALEELDAAGSRPAPGTEHEARSFRSQAR